ncbi:MAG: AAA family ATPase [Halobacteriales archaeon]
MSQSRSIELAVAESDSGTGDGVTARLPEGPRRKLGVLSGDTVVLDGERAAVATVWPASGGVAPEEVALDGKARRLLGVSPGDRVVVRAAAVEDATSVTVEMPESVPKEAGKKAVRRELAERPVSPGDRLRLDGDPVRVVDTHPAGTVRVTGDTAVYVRSPPESGGDVAGGGAGGDGASARATYDDIGGLDDELDLVREAVELPLAEPGLFEEFGVEPPTGVLLYGPPGTGKTLIAEAVASAVDATFYHVSGPEITSKYKGESEERLREIFERAREDAPAIVFFDEIDAIAPERDDGGDMENRVVGQLLSLMDGLESRGDVVVIGATNRVDAIDPALRRPGRFDREIEIGVPDEGGRREVLAVHTRDVPLAEDVDLDRLASHTHGYVGADLKALVTEAAMLALRRAREDEGPMEVTRDDVEAALAATEPSAMREFVAETPETGFDDVGGLEEAKATLREAVSWPLSHPELFEETGTAAPSGILLYGPPGTGKTLLARAVASESDVNFVSVAGPELLDKYVGESEKAVREVFERARQSAPSIVFFDEIDSIATERRGDDDATERVVSQLLAELDGLADNPNLVVLAATNRREALDPALLRPGRLETHVEVPDPDEAARREILAIHTEGKPLAPEVDLDALAADLAGATGAEIESLAREASMLSIREAVSERGIAEASARAGEIEIGPEHFERAREKTNGM